MENEAVFREYGGHQRNSGPEQPGMSPDTSATLVLVSTNQMHPLFFGNQALLFHLLLGASLTFFFCCGLPLLQPANSVLSDALITRLTDGIYIHTRQIIVGEAVQMESTRTRRLSGENTYLESQEDAPELDLTHVCISSELCQRTMVMFTYLQPDQHVCTLCLGEGSRYFAKRNRYCISEQFRSAGQTG